WSQPVQRSQPAPLAQLSPFTTTTTMTVPGELVARRYRLLQPVGQGTMSTVFAARDTWRADMQVAVKLLNAQYADDLRREMFRRETRALERLEHPNIVRIFDHGVDEALSCAFLVLEWVPRTLQDLIDEHQGNTASGWHWPLLRQMADALAAAHSEGII